MNNRRYNPNSGRFDRDPFDRIDRKAGKVFGLAFVGVILSWIVSLGLLVAGIYVAVHFLSKVW